MPQLKPCVGDLLSPSKRTVHSKENTTLLRHENIALHQKPWNAPSPAIHVERVVTTHRQVASARKPVCVRDRHQTAGLVERAMHSYYIDRHSAETARLLNPVWPQPFVKLTPYKQQEWVKSHNLVAYWQKIRCLSESLGSSHPSPSQRLLSGFQQQNKPQPGKRTRQTHFFPLKAVSLLLRRVYCTITIVRKR
jgi:hypothetical protein